MRIRPGAGLAVRAAFPPAPALEREEQQLATFGLVCRRHGTGTPALVAARKDHVLFYVPLAPVAAPRLLSVAVQNRPTHPITDQDKLTQTNTNVTRRSHHGMPCFIVAPRSPHWSLPCTYAHTLTHTHAQKTPTANTQQTHHAILSEVLTARRCRSSMILSWASLRIHASRFCASHGHFAAARRFPEHSRVYDSGQETGVDCGGSGGAVWRTGVRGRCEAGEARRKRALIIFLRSLSHSLDIFSKLSVVYSCRSCAALPLLSALFVWTQVS